MQAELPCAQEYLRQLERDNHVPEGMQLVRPEAAFALRVPIVTGSTDSSATQPKKGQPASPTGIPAVGDVDVMYINVVCTDAIQKPRIGARAAGNRGQVPSNLQTDSASESKASREPEAAGAGPRVALELPHIVAPPRHEETQSINEQLRLGAATASSGAGKGRIEFV
jgi:hypothetical protein